MNKYIRTMLFFSVIGFCHDSAAAMVNPLMAAVVNQVNKVSKKPIHKSPIEYRHAIERYIASTKAHSLPSHAATIGKGKIASYEIELQYLFNNYGRFSTLTLLSRLRSAHQEMVKINYDANKEKYQQYEQVCSALLLQCAQMLSDNARKQLLDALHEVDDLIIYWRYQKNHPLSYCFGKSPFKWVMGKSQEKEVNSNIRRLEYKQAELYTTLGKLTAHAHSFTECGMAYADCYAWIEELFSVLSCIKIGYEKANDGTQFDKIAALLELKIKSVDNLKYHCLRSIALVKKSNHFVRNWIAYTTLVAASAYAVHYHLNHAGVMFAAYTATQKSASDYCGLLLNPLDKVYQRGKLIFSEDEKKVEVKKVQEDQSSKSLIDRMSVIQLLAEIDRVGTDIPVSIAKELARSNSTILQDVEAALDASFDALEQAGLARGCILNSYTIDRALIKKSLLGDGTDEFPGGNTKPLTKLYNDLGKLGWITNYDVKADLKMNGVLGWIVKAFLEPLQRYTDIIDGKIIRLIELIAVLVVRLGKEADDQLQQADAKLKDNELTFMFTALIPLAGTCFGTAWIYQWATARDYSPIRIALADVNSLLIESPMPLDDYDYGKLVYLVHKLRNKASSLKDALCGEFLADVTKLESKRFDVAAKRGIVDNMFNRYAFLGRIAT